MTTLYLHGLHGMPENQRTYWLKQFGQVINPAIHYKNYHDIFKQLSKLVITYQPKVLVGSSMGGFMAFHLGNYFRIPTILLNPALLITNIVKPDNRLVVSDVSHTISIGKNDKVIYPETTFAVLKQYRANARIFQYEIGHKTPFDVFLDVCKKSGLFS
jgi:putative lipase involved disintegration of autophagic bodies